MFHTILPKGQNSTVKFQAELYNVDHFEKQIEVPASQQNRNLKVCKKCVLCRMTRFLAIWYLIL